MADDFEKKPYPVRDASYPVQKYEMHRIQCEMHRIQCEMHRAPNSKRSPNIVKHLKLRLNYRYKIEDLFICGYSSGFHHHKSKIYFNIKADSAKINGNCWVFSGGISGWPRIQNRRWRGRTSPDLNPNAAAASQTSPAQQLGQLLLCFSLGEQRIQCRNGG